MTVLPLHNAERQESLPITSKPGAFVVRRKISLRVAAALQYTEQRKKGVTETSNILTKERKA